MVGLENRARGADMTNDEMDFDLRLRVSAIKAIAACAMFIGAVAGFGLFIEWVA